MLPEDVRLIANRLNHWVVENAKTARRILKAYDPDRVIAEIEMATLNEHTQEAELRPLLAPLLAGKDVGLISEAGCPGVADPGAQLVRLAHEQNIRVIPLVGPSSILLALMASGASGQRFRFHGYLPTDAQTRSSRLKELEGDSRRHQETQLFIETPYRNMALLDALLNTCRPDTLLAVACDLTTPTEQIISRTIASWKKQEKPELGKRPALFLIYAGH
nr:SAM-dependent methyltransferase [Parachitinimonas caeni]